MLDSIKYSEIALGLRMYTKMAQRIQSTPSCGYTPANGVKYLSAEFGELYVVYPKELKVYSEPLGVVATEFPYDYKQCTLFTP